MRRSIDVWVLAVLWFAVLGSAAGAIYCKHLSRARFVELERLNAQRDELQVEWGRLQLEQSYWSSHAFVESVAAKRLRMRTPSPASVVLVQP